MAYDNNNSKGYKGSDRGDNRSSGLTGLAVQVKRNDVDKAIRILKKKVAQEGVLKDLKRHEFYEKPSVRRRRQRAEAVSRWRKKERQMRDEL